MQKIKIAAGVVNQKPMDWQGNTQHLSDAIAQARADQVQLLCLPELAITGYGCEDAFLGHDLDEQALRELEKIIPLCEDIVVCVGLPLRWHGALFNVVAIIVNAQLRGFYAKQFLAGDGVHYEPRWFQAWPQDIRVAYPWPAVKNKTVPLGDIFVDVGGLRIGFEICEDAWVPQRPAAGRAKDAIDIILNPSASHFAFGKFETRQAIVKEASRALQATYVYTNLLGNEAGRIIFDGGAIIASGGALAALGQRFGLDDWQLCHAVVDVGATRRKRAAMTSFEVDVVDDAACVHVDWQMTVTKEAPAQVKWQAQTDEKEICFTRVVSLGLIDYVRKSHSNGFVISLSGGADSAAVAMLVRQAWDFGLAHFGTEQWLRRIHMPAQTTFKEWCTCVYQRTQNSGAVTEAAARTLANAIDARFAAIDVEEIVAAYTERTQEILGRELLWQHDDIALQNIQARARAPSMWMLANCLNALLLATSNRSEAAVGYATMDGDTCGGLSPLAGIDKHFLLHWLRWMEITGAEDILPQPALACINKQKPTAELRPESAGQTDEDDLMPYPVLDAIERLAIRDKLNPQDCLDCLAQQFSIYKRPQLIAWVRRFFQLWCRNQWKRERYAPGFHLDDENLDPKTWCRFPIFSGGFTRELEVLM